MRRTICEKNDVNEGDDEDDDNDDDDENESACKEETDEVSRIVTQKLRKLILGVNYEKKLSIT